MRIEEKCKKVTAMIKDAKNKNQTQRSNHVAMISEDKKNKLEDEVKELEEAKRAEEKKYK